MQRVDHAFHPHTRCSKRAEPITHPAEAGDDEPGDADADEHGCPIQRTCRFPPEPAGWMSVKPAGSLRHG